MMMRILALLALAVLIGCAQEPPPDPEPAPAFRDTSAQIASQADVTAERMAGRWFVRQSFGRYRLVTELNITTTPEGVLNVALPMNDCLHDICVGWVPKLVPSGIGRWMPKEVPVFKFPKDEVWVMWMDFDSRTMAVGTPSGDFGWILDKSPTGGEDRITAAREIMDWFGYDLTRLQ